MIHLSNISINPSYIVAIKWSVIKDNKGNSIRPSVAVILDIPDTNGEDTFLYFPEDSPNARLLKEARDKGSL